MMEKVKTKKWDSAEFLTSVKEVVAYLNACFEEYGDDPAMIAHAFGVVARARGMSKVAKKAGLTRESLYKALSAEGNPEFSTILKVANALGVRLRAA
jgi:probable addiction module antidote protein